MKLNEKITGWIAENKISQVTVGFSCGKDSIATVLTLQEAGVSVIPIYFYVFPGLSFVDDAIIEFENKLNVKIAQYPHPMLYDFLRHQDFMPPGLIEYFAGLNIPKITFDKLTALHCIDALGIDEHLYNATGMRAAESFNRRKMFEKSGFFDHKRKHFFPIMDWKVDDVKACLQHHNIKLPIDYKYWNRSYDGMKYQFMIGLEKNFPSDFDKISELFPLLKIENMRYELNAKYFE